MKLFIKNMVSNRCIIMVKMVLDHIGIRYTDVKLGEISIKGELTALQCSELNKELAEIGLEPIMDRESMLIENIKNSIMEIVHHSDEPATKKISCILSEKLKYDYTYLATLFKRSKGICIQDYIIAQKIERVKQLLAFGNLNLSEISYQMNYSSVAHLSYQFKKVTGVRARDFKQLENKGFIPLEVI